MEEGDGGGELRQECKLLSDTRLGSNPVGIRPTEMHADENHKL